jgi:hypothetical protein
LPQLDAHYIYGSCAVYNATITVVGTQEYGVVFGSTVRDKPPPVEDQVPTYWYMESSFDPWENHTAFSPATTGKHVEPGIQTYPHESPVEVQGNVTFLVDFEDPAGNQGENVTRVTRETWNQGFVAIDTIVPILPFVSVVSNNVKHSTLAKEGDTIFLTVNASEWIDLPYIEIAERAAEGIERYGGYQYDTWHSIDMEQLHAHYLFESCPKYNATITVREDDVQGNISFLIKF